MRAQVLHRLAGVEGAHRRSQGPTQALQCSLFIGHHLHSLAHTQAVIDETFDIYEEIMKQVDTAVRKGQRLSATLKPLNFSLLRRS